MRIAGTFVAVPSAAMKSPKRRTREKKLLLSPAKLSVGTLLAIACGGHVDGEPNNGPDEVGNTGGSGGITLLGTGGIVGNPKGPYYTGGYGGLPGTGGLTGNPKGPWYDSGGYPGTGGLVGAGGVVGNPKSSWYDSGGYPSTGGQASDA